MLFKNKVNVIIFNVKLRNILWFGEYFNGIYKKLIKKSYVLFKK